MDSLTKRRERVSHTGFVRKILASIGEAAAMGGSQQSDLVRQRIKRIMPAEQERVLKARFALGADDGAYMRQNVMPLQTVDPDCDDYALGGNLSPEIQSAGRAGLLAALDEELKSVELRLNGELGEMLMAAAWLTTIEEVYTFVSDYAARNASEAARILVRLFDPAGDVQEAARVLATVANPTEMQTRCEVLHILLLVFAKPMNAMLTQYEATVGANGTGTKQVFDGINRVAQTARYERATWEAEQLPIPSRVEDILIAGASLPATLGIATPAAPTGGPLENIWKALQRSGAVLRGDSSDDDDEGDPLIRPPGDGADAVADGSSVVPSDTPSLPPAPASPAGPGAPPAVAPVAIDYCSTVTITSDVDKEAAKDAVCAAVGQLREDGGFGFDTQTNRVLRGTGVSPFWTSAHKRILQRDSEEEDYWRKTLWPLKEAHTWTTVDQLAQKLDVATRLPSGNVADESLVNEAGTRALVYAMTRGLCGERAAHQRVLRGGRLPYNLPQMAYPDLSMALEDVSISPIEEARSRTAFPYVNVPVVKDFVAHLKALPDPSKPILPAKVAQWAPVTPVNVDGTTVYKVDSSEPTAALAEASVCEHLATYYKTLHANTKSDGAAAQDLRGFLLACAAAAKVKQLNALGTVFSLNRTKLSQLAKATPVSDAASRQHVFITRPVLVCPDRSVLYPCDAGLWSMTATAAVQTAPDDAPGTEPDEPRSGAPDGTGARRALRRDTGTAYLRAALSDSDNTKAPVYIAYRPGTNEPNLNSMFARGPVPVRDFADGIFPEKLVDMATLLRNALKVCSKLQSINNERVHVDELKKAEDDAPTGDDLARLRRAAVWDDALREACISGDRLYSFVRQFSGTISESVDAVCQIDEGMLVRQQQQLRERRARISDRAAQEHMTLVRNVFGAVIRESGLTLGITNDGATGDIGQLKVMSNTLRKQLTDLTQQGSSTDGFFANSVRLEQLLQKGTGEMTLSDLFAKLQDAGSALQAAAAASSSDDMPGSSVSIDFLSAPRNSLILRYKPEALAAMRQAFDVFQREMMAQHGRMYRTISAYELIEGSDESLCSAFAAFAAHMLVHARMYSSSTAMYVAAWPAAANAQQLKISLQRLVRVACSYLAYAASPNFLSDTGRAAYFAQSTAIGMPVAPPRYLVPHGQWGLNLYS